MNRQEFFRQLEDQLKKVPHEEALAALEYYREYFDEAGEENEEDVLRELGTPERIVSQIRAEIAMKNLNKEEAPSVKKGISAIWLVILAIFAAPIALPLAIAAVAVVAALSIAALAIVLSLVVAVVAMFCSGIFAVGVGIAYLFSSFSAGLCAVGVGLVTLGITVLMGMLAVFAARGLSRLIARMMNNLLQNTGKRGNRNEQ